MTAPQQSSVVVVGIDGSDMGEAALRWAERYADLTGGALRIVVAWQVPMTYGAMPVVYDNFDPEADASQLAEKAAASVSLAADRVSTVVVEGSPRTALTETAADADLLVVGSRGHGAVGGMLLGSVSSYCVQHAAVPVVVVR